MTSTPHHRTAAATGPAGFAAALSAAGTPPADVAVSDDGRAFTVSYSDFQLEVNNGPGAPAPVAARWEWFTIPLAEPPQGVEIALVVQGHAAVDDPARATVVVVVNALTAVETVLPGPDRDLLVPLTVVTGGFDGALTVGVGLLVDGAGGAAASVTVRSVDAEVRG